MKKLFNFFVLSIAAISLISGCGSKESETEPIETEPAMTEDAKVLHDYLVYNGNSFFVKGLSWTDTWEDVKDAMSISEDDIISGTDTEHFVKCPTWSDSAKGYEAEVEYGFPKDTSQLSYARVTIKVSSEESARALLKEIIQWVKDYLPSPRIPTDSEALKLDTDEMIEMYLVERKGIDSSFVSDWDAPDGSQFSFDFTRFEVDCYVEIHLSVVNPRFAYDGIYAD